MYKVFSFYNLPKSAFKQKEKNGRRRREEHRRAEDLTDRQAITSPCLLISFLDFSLPSKLLWFAYDTYTVLG